MFYLISTLTRLLVFPAAALINERIALLNRYLVDLCLELPNAELIDTAAAVTDENGYLRADFTTDGIHLNETAYRAVLRVICEYGMKKQANTV